MWGPIPIRLGFIGAPIATAISFNLISIMSISYGIFFVPRTAWHPLSCHMFKGLGVLLQLGLSGVGNFLFFISSKQQKWDPLRNCMNRSNRFRMVGLGISCSCSFSVRFSRYCLHPYMLKINQFIRLGPAVLAAQSVLLVSASSTFQAPFALGVATSIR